MTGWKFVREDAAWHYFKDGQSLCGMFTLDKRQFTPRKPHLPDACGKCTKSAPPESSQRPPPEAT